MTTACPQCQSESLRWSVRRAGGRTVLHSPREFIWMCRACGAQWSDPVHFAVPADPTSSPGPPGDQTPEDAA
jgi:hypothetical protein